MGGMLRWLIGAFVLHGRFVAFENIQAVHLTNVHFKADKECRPSQQVALTSYRKDGQVDNASA
jgi:hypothetical protein